MRITVPKKELESAVKIAELALEKSYRPILNLLILDARGPEVAIIGVSNTAFVRVALAGAQRDSGFNLVTLDPKLVLNALKSVSDATTELELSGAKATLRTKVGRVLVNGSEDTADHPIDLSQHLAFRQAGEDYLDVATADFASSLAFCAPNTSVDDNRPNLEGIQVLAVDGQLRLVATDGSALGIASIPYAGDIANGMIIPNQGVELLLAVLSGRTTRLNRVVVGEKRTDLEVFTAGIVGRGKVYLKIRLIDAQFPNIAEVLPAQDRSRACELLVADFEEAAKAIVSLETAAAKRGGNRTGAIEITLPFQQSSAPKMQMTGRFLSLSGDDYPIAEIDATPLSAVSEKPIQALFNVELFKTTLLAGIQTEQMVFQCDGELQPSSIRPVGLPADVDQLKVIMPVRR